jgi:hypothetical protein
MPNVTVNWVLPTTRVSGKPLSVDQIEYVFIEVSADGVAYVPVGEFTPDVLSTAVSDLDVGDWLFRGTVVDTKGRPSLPVESSISFEDNTPPGALASLTIDLAA